MRVNLENCIQPDIVGIMGEGSPRVTTADPVKSRGIRRDPQYQTLCEDWRRTSIGGLCDC